MNSSRTEVFSRELGASGTAKGMNLIMILAPRDYIQHTIF